MFQEAVNRMAGLSVSGLVKGLPLTTVVLCAVVAKDGAFFPEQARHSSASPLRGLLGVVT